MIAEAPAPPAVKPEVFNPTELRYALHPKQLMALESDATELFYGGAAGGGKSHYLRIDTIAWCTQIAGLQAFLFRRLYADLKQNHMEGPSSYPVLLAPLIARRLVKIVESEIRFWNGSKIYLRHCMNDNALLKYQGAEIHLLCMDELTHFTDGMYRYLRGRCRVAGIKIPPQYAHLFPRIRGGANPGGVGHGWVKATFVDGGAFVKHRVPIKEGGGLRQFIPARVEDNPTLMQQDPTYIERLEGLGDPLLVRAMKEGDWDVVAGSMYGETWRRYDNNGDPWHVIAGFDVPAGWDIWRGADDGFALPAACYWFTQNPDTKTIYVIDELYKAGMLPNQFAEEVRNRDRALLIKYPDGTLTYNNQPLNGLLDSAAFSNTGQAEISRGDAMNAFGMRWQPVEKGSGSRVERVQHLHRLLAVNPYDAEKKPAIQFFARCENAIRTIPTLPRDKRNPEDIDTASDDHAFDGVTYGLKWKRDATRLIRTTGI